MSGLEENFNSTFDSSGIFRGILIGVSCLVLGYGLRMYQPSLTSYVTGWLPKESSVKSGRQIEKNGGVWHKLSNNRKNNNLKGLGYLSGYEKTDRKGVSVHKQSKSWDGLNFYLSASGAKARLMKMDGSVLHEWTYPFQKAFPNHEIGKEQRYWREAYLYPNGDLLAIYSNNGGLVKLNKNSEPIWTVPIKAHHDLWISPEGKIYVLNYKVTRLRSYRIPSSLRGSVVMSDNVTVLSSEGEVLKEYSILQAMNNSKFASMLKFVHTRDIFHTNTVEILQQVPPGMPEPFKKGRALISMRRLNFIGLMDLEKETMVWGRMAHMEGQHDPRILKNGNILLYDNRASHHNKLRKGGFSRILEMAPDDWTIEWKLSGKDDLPFYSACCGRNQPLPNGNLLITDSDSGRAFEVTKEEKELVWEYYIPERLDKKNNYIPAMYGMRRMSKDRLNDWYKK
ncbi:MAG: arylsulfotransferase family protein [bacterium]